MLIELGGGLTPHPGAAVVIDPVHPVAAPPQLGQQTPWMRTGAGADEVVPGGCADEVYAGHVMEHVPRGADLVATMNEAWRVLRPGGCFTMIMPIVGFTEPGRGRGRLVARWQPYADPMHVNYWWLPEAILYFCEGPFKAAADYGIKPWMPLGAFIPAKRVDAALREEPPRSFWSVRQGWEGVVRILKPVMDEEQPDHA
jgi:hypothetical protein